VHHARYYNIRVNESLYLLFSLLFGFHDGAADLTETVAAGATRSTRVEGLGTTVASWLGHGVVVHGVATVSMVKVGRELGSSSVNVQV
jgi:hypothetical protein